MHRSIVMLLALVVFMAGSAVGAVPQDTLGDRLMENEIRGVVPVTVSYVGFDYEEESFGYTFHYEGAIEITTWPGGYQEITGCAGDAWFTGSHWLYDTGYIGHYEDIAYNKQSVDLFARGIIEDPTPPRTIVDILVVDVTFSL